MQNENCPVIFFQSACYTQFLVFCVLSFFWKVVGLTSGQGKASYPFTLHCFSWLIT